MKTRDELVEETRCAKLLERDMNANKYKVIYADPPWKFSPMGIKPEKIWHAKYKKRQAEAHYPTMELDDICALPIKNISDSSCVLFMWVTNPFLEQGFRVIHEWGFKYKTVAFVWAKQNKQLNGFSTSMGWYTLSQCELCLIATKGKTLPRQAKNIRQLVLSVKTRHSEKPSEVRKRIELMYGDVPRIELFARQETKGWDVWGNEVNDVHFID